jgi:3-hydroxy-D-aspartate aldolase
MLSSLNAALVGQPGSASRLQTPALLVDLERFELNLHAMQQHCASAGIALRPHAKTHRCVEIARRQIAAGAVGICCAKLGEAEVMAQGGIDSILLTSPVVAPAGIERLLRLHEQLRELLVVVDHPDNARALAAAAKRSARPLHVLLDVDPGLHRTGIAPGESALALAQQIADSGALVFRGLQQYPGQLMHAEKFAERRELGLGALAALAAFRRALSDRGLQCEIVSGGGTGTFDIDVEAGVLSELQAGSYLFMDRQYNDIEACAGRPWRFLTSLFVQTTVVSCNRPGLATTDAGLKAFATDAGAPVVHEGAPAGARYFFFGDEHGGVSWKSAEKLELGAQLRVVTPHCDPTFNLHDAVHVIQGDRLVDLWAIDARGRSA